MNLADLDDSALFRNSWTEIWPDIDYIWRGGGGVVKVNICKVLQSK